MSDTKNIWYITFPEETSWEDRYVTIKAADYPSARKKAYVLFKDNWKFVLSEAAFISEKCKNPKLRELVKK